MWDSMRLQFRGFRWNDDVRQWVLREYPTAGFSLRHYDANMPWEGCTIDAGRLGRVGVKSNQTGNYLWAEVSLPKYLFGENSLLLSAEQAVQAANAWVDDLRAKFGQWFINPDSLPVPEVKRVDLCYQQQVPCSEEVTQYIAAALNARKVVLYDLMREGNARGVLDIPTLEMYLTGLRYTVSRFELCRFYDKGVESGDESYINHLRHEEQFRGGKAGGLVPVIGGKLYGNREMLRDVMNARFDGFGTGEVFELANLLKENKVQGAAALGLVLHPEYENLYKHNLAKTTFYRVRALAMACRKQRIPVNLRLPVDAWTQPAVKPLAKKKDMDRAEAQQQMGSFADFTDSQVL